MPLSNKSLPFLSCWVNATASVLSQQTSPLFLTILFSHIPPRCEQKPLADTDECLWGMDGPEWPCSLHFCLWHFPVSSQISPLVRLQMLKSLVTVVTLHIQQRSLNFLSKMCIVSVPKTSGSVIYEKETQEQRLSKLQQTQPAKISKVKGTSRQFKATPRGLLYLIA